MQPEPSTVALNIRQIRGQHSSLCLKINNHKVWSAVAYDLDDAIRTAKDWLDTIGATPETIEQAQIHLKTKRVYKTSFKVNKRSYSHAPVYP